jgi:2-dehydro-3-deoxyphosphogluconate aldolase/(4S)-4-hydroxy-2-oxoglutarate aldolase
MAKVCNRRKISWSPGCGSLSEISQAEELGAEVVKIFPGSQVGGPGFVKAVLGPCPWSSIMPTGGVSPDEENLSGWIKAGVHCVGMGSQLMVKDESGNFNLEAIKQKTKEAIAIIKRLRN